MQSVYILGSSGYIGQNLLGAEGRYAPNFCVKSVGRSKSCSIHLDLENGEYSDLLNSVRVGDYAVFLAAISAPDVCKNAPEKARRVNVTNTIGLIDALLEKGVKIIFTSSDMVFGRSTGKQYDGAPCSPMGDYGSMKAEVESHYKGNSNVKIIRFSYVCGQGDKYTEMLVEMSLKNKTVDVFKGFSRNIVAVSDVVEGVYALLAKWDMYPHQYINFSGPDLISREALTSALKDVMPDLQFKAVEAPEGFWESRSKVIETDCRNFTELLGRPPKNLKEIVHN